VWRYSINSVVGIPLSQMSIEILGLEFGLMAASIMDHEGKWSMMDYEYSQILFQFQPLDARSV
jgi:hypothetical protein